MNIPKLGWLVWVVVTQHYYWGLNLIFKPNSQALSLLGGYQYFIDSFGSVATGMLMITVSTISAYALIKYQTRSPWFGVAGLMPQYIVVGLSLITAVIFVVHDTYQVTRVTDPATGQIVQLAKPITVHPDRVITANVLSQFVIVAIFHTIAVLSFWFEAVRYPERRKKEEKVEQLMEEAIPDPVLRYELKSIIASK